MEPKDYFSFCLADKKGYLTNAGRLFADQYIVYNSRFFVQDGMVWKKDLFLMMLWMIKSLKEI
jgi:hypothetical protein